MRKELVVCLLVAVSVCFTASAQAQLFRRWRAPQVQAPCPQQQALAQRQKQRVAQQSPQQAQYSEASSPQVNQSVAWVVVDQQGRVLRQLSDGEVAQFLRQQQAVQQQTRDTGQVAASPSASSPEPEADLPGAQTNNVAVTRPQPTSQPVVTGYASAPQGGAQVDIARQAVVATPTLAGPTTTTTFLPPRTKPFQERFLFWNPPKMAFRFWILKPILVQERRCC